MSNLGPRTLISADSHVIEPVELWEDLLPGDYWGNTAASFSKRPGGFDPKARIEEMEVDRVAAEVLYPSMAMKLFTEGAELQRECFTRYNDWVAEYCQAAPERLIGIGLLAVHDIDAAIAEAHRSADLGLRGVQVWQCPPPELAFNTGHYDPLWEACSDLRLPVNLHILTGYGYPEEIYKRPGGLADLGDFAFKTVINDKVGAVMGAVAEILFSGAFDRYPDLQLMLVENEVGWLPFFIDQLDYYWARFSAQSPISLERTPSETFTEQLFATFFRDPNAAWVASVFPNTMWSSDYPHGNSTWPESQQVVESRIGHLPDDEIYTLTQGTVSALYDIRLPEED